MCKWWGGCTVKGPLTRMPPYNGILREDHMILREDNGILREDHGFLREEHGFLREDPRFLRGITFFYGAWAVRGPFKAQLKITTVFTGCNSTY